MVDSNDRLSYVGMHSHDNYEYAIQYKNAFFTLYKSSQSIDTLVLPMMFLLRHYLELALKYNIKYFEEYSDHDCKNVNLQKEHKLHILSNCFFKYYENIFDKIKTSQKETLEYFTALNELIGILNSLDKQSMSFRYSHDNKKAQKHFNWMQQIDIYKIKGLFDDMLPLLENSIDVFEDKTGLMHGASKEIVLKLLKKE